MHTVRATKYRVRETEVSKFEELIREQAAKVKDLAPGVVLYAFCRRRLDASLFPQPQANTIEYVLHVAVLDAGSNHQMNTVESALAPDIKALLVLEPEVELIEAPDYVVGVTREVDWSPSSVWRLSIFRMRVKPGTEDQVRANAQRLIGRVQEYEPDPPVYALTQRRASSTFLPAPPSGRTEFMRFHAYQTEEALDLHHEYDELWWAPFYRAQLDGPLESVQFDAEDVVCGFSREATWGAPTPYGSLER